MYNIGWTLKTIHALLTNHCIGSICAQYSCHIGSLNTQRLQPYTVVKVGGGIDPAIEITKMR